MKRISAILILRKPIWIFAGVVAWTFLAIPAPLAAQDSAKKATTTPVAVSAKTFETPQQAADALVQAAEKFDVGVIEEIFGPDGDDIVLSGEFPQDRKRAADFAAEAGEKKTVSVDPKRGNRAFLLVGKADWPVPVPSVKLGDKWYFDAKAGRLELLHRRIGADELDAIDVCRGYVE